jgi:hypothetical protein
MVGYKISVSRPFWLQRQWSIDHVSRLAAALRGTRPPLFAVLPMAIVAALVACSCNKPVNAVYTDPSAPQSATTAISSSAAAAASFQYVLGDALYPYSTQSKPDKGQSYVDSKYHTTITRVTDSNADRNTWGTITEYPQWDPSSSDGKYILFESCEKVTYCGGYVLYDAITYKYLGKMPLSWFEGQDPEPRWDRTGAHSHRFTYRKHMQLRYYDVDTKSDGLVHDFAADFPQYRAATDSTSGYYAYCHEYCSPSADGRYYSFYLQNSGGTYDSKLVFVYDNTLDKVVSSQDVSSTPFKGVMMSPSGNYVVINEYWCDAGNCGERAFTRDFSKSVQLTGDVTHMNFGWTIQGHEVAIGVNAGTDELTFIRLDTGQSYVLYDIKNMGWGANMLHTYMSKPGWALLNTYAQDNTAWAYNQIFAFELDETKCLRSYDSRQSSASHSCSAGKPRIWRVSFTQNAADITGSRYYFQQSNVQANVDGTKLWFGANWRDVNGAPDVYQITLPPNWWDNLRNLR